MSFPGPSVCISSPVAASHTFTVLSSLPEARRVPSWLNATAVTIKEWPLSVRTSSPVAVSHTFTALSPPAEARRVPSGLNATPNTPLNWRSVSATLPAAGTHTFTVSL